MSSLLAIDKDCVTVYLNQVDLSSPGDPITEAKIDSHDFINLGIVLAVGVVILRTAWVGYVGSDDHSYAQGALGWLEQFPRPYVGDDHWTLRHPVVIPVAISLALFGFREISLALPSALFFLLFLATNYCYLRQFLGAAVALLTGIMLATTPLFAVQATFSQNVIIQVLAVSNSFWLFFTATRSGGRGWLMFAAGLAAAVGWLTLETTAGLLLFYGILFIIGFGIPRRSYWIMALAFALIVGAEISYFTALTGDPLYRYRIDFHHDVVDRSGDVTVAKQTGTFLDLEGNLSVNVFLQPILALLLNQEFGVLFWLVVPATIWIWQRKKAMPFEDARLLRLLTGLIVIWILFVSVSGSLLWIVPRYYSVATWAGVIIVVYSLRSVFVPWPKVGIFVAAGWLVTNLFCIYVENKNPLFTERALVQYIVKRPYIVYTDPMTVTRAKLLLEFEGVVDRVTTGPVPAGGVVYVNRSSIERCKRLGHRCRWQWEQYFPKANWTELERIEADPKRIGALLSFIQLDQIIPAEIFNRLAGKYPTATLYQINP